MGSVWPHSFPDPRSKALSLHCYWDNYSWYYLLELGLPRTKTGAFFLLSPGMCWCSEPSRCKSLWWDGFLGCGGILQLMKSCSPDPKPAVHHLQCRRQPLLTSLFVKYQLSSKKSRGFALRTSSDTKTKQEFGTYGVSFWKLVLGAKQWLQGAHRRVGKGQTPPLPHTSTGGARALIGGCISVTSLLVPFTWLNLFKPIYSSVKEGSPI